MLKLLRVSRYFISTLVVALSFLFVGVNDANSATTTIESWTSASSDFPSSIIPHNSAVTPGQRTGGVVWSRHNLSTYGPVFQSQTEITTILPGFTFAPEAGTTQVCVFCHTPHHARTDTAPLWNKDNLATYTSYGPTLAGTSTDVSGSSLACLSCHDGVTTFDNIINRPGKGSGQPTGVAGDTTNDMWMGWTMWPVGVKSTETKADHFRVHPNCAACHPQAESTRLNIGMGPNFSITEASSPWDDDGQPLSGNGDLTNDHPIGVAYEADGRASLRSTSTQLSSISMAQANTVHGSGSPTAEFGRSDNFWSVFGYIKADATIDDLLRNGGQVECASCHDPHYKNQTNNDPSLVDSYNRTGGVTPGGIGYNYTVSGQFDEKIDGLFLRRVGGNSNSGVCRTCHAK